MTPPNTDRQALRRKNALRGALSATILQLVTGALLLWCGGHTDSGLLSTLLLIAALLDLGAIVPIWISFKIRLREIQGGEEDAAAQY